jgi:tetratricopeptide (TPR) repeat protein
MNRIEQLKSFLQESPGDNFLIHALALEFIKGGDDQSGLSYFLSNLENSPQYIPTYYHLGKLYERIGETQKAIDIYARGMEIAKESGDNHAFSELRSVYEELIW